MSFFRLLTALLLTQLTHAVYTESISGFGLIGSHFGVPGIPLTFDYVVLGGGTAGLTLAARLASESGNSVAVVEAGDFYEFVNGNFSQIPAEASQFTLNGGMKNPLLDWYQMTTPQPQLDGRSVFLPSGKVLGGSSARNFLWYMRSARDAFQKWADLLDDQSWTFDALLPYFKRSVHFTPPDNSRRFANSTAAYNASYFSPDGGPLQVSYPSWVNAASSWIGNGLSSLGLKQLNGMDDGNISGWSYIPSTQDSDQVRSTSESSFLRMALANTTNLSIYKSTLAKRVVFDGDKKAAAVVVSAGGMEYMLNATKEVVVSTGAFRSPQMLMVSGIGPRETLDQLKIPVVAESPGVGQNLWDHVLFHPVYKISVPTHSRIADPTFLAEQTLNYQTNRTGILTNSGGDVAGFEKLPAGSLSNATQAQLDAFSPDWPEVEYLSLDAFIGYGNITAAPDAGDYLSLSTLLCKPFSRGNVTINSTDTAANPLVSTNWLTDARDREVALAAVRRTRQIFAAPDSRGVIIGAEVLPGPQVQSDEAVLAWLRQSVGTDYHSSATNAMGRDGDAMAVLDARARVRGVKGLRVVDASAFPVLPPGHPQSAVYALAEKIADHMLHGD